MVMQIIQHTLALGKKDTIETVHGTIPAFQWLENEAARIGRDTSRIVEIRPVGGIGKRALFVNDIGVVKKGGYEKTRVLKWSERC